MKSLTLENKNCKKIPGYFQMIAVSQVNPAVNILEVTPMLSLEKVFSKTNFSSLGNI